LALFEASARSVCAQLDSDFKYIVVCNQRPEIDFSHPNLHYHVVDFPIVGELTPDPGTAIEIKQDKGCKLLAGTLFARQFNPEYYLFIDADDWVDTRLVGTLASSPSADVWYADKGYYVNARTRHIRWVRGMTRYCGSTFLYHKRILDSYLQRWPELDENSTKSVYLDTCEHDFLIELLGDHLLSFDRAREQGWSVRAIPFPAVCWVVDGGENVSHTTIASKGLSMSTSMSKRFGQLHIASNAHTRTLRDLIIEAIRVTKSWLTWRITRHTRWDVF